jgi:hypothetical protein
LCGKKGKLERDGFTGEKLQEKKPSRENFERHKKQQTFSREKFEDEKSNLQEQKMYV